MPDFRKAGHKVMLLHPHLLCTKAFPPLLKVPEL